MDWKAPVAGFQYVLFDRKDPARDIDRFYLLAWRSTLLDSGAVVRLYGRKGRWTGIKSRCLSYRLSIVYGNKGYEQLVRTEDGLVLEAPECLDFRLDTGYPRHLIEISIIAIELRLFLALHLRHNQRILKVHVVAGIDIQRPQIGFPLSEL